jgi:hypothetical protein
MPRMAAVAIETTVLFDKEPGDIWRGPFSGKFPDFG